MSALHGSGAPSKLSVAKSRMPLDLERSLSNTWKRTDLICTKVTKAEKLREIEREDECQFCNTSLTRR